jgi:molecular chaperone HtpG
LVESLSEFKEKKLIRADQADIELEDTTQEGESLSEAETSALSTWWTEVLEGSIKEVKSGKRLVGSPVVALVPEDSPNAQMRSMMKAMGQEVPAITPVLAINTRHPLVKKLSALREQNPEVAGLVARQLSDQALLSAGLVEHPQELAIRMNAILEKLL